ncbi:helix-turn-helix domain-containing protein [Novosphingobium sp. Chol11]|uniref:helix-turn-helix domain-containing protein n=1 Tax=Novosphingobium sp. Chol11 TaxID=1385763 RepID=UPI0015966764|nr:helix-turn-helix transcriptional regulator [Novosphingobium sp. Chol11]
MAESVAERVFAIYSEAFGSIEPLFEHVGQRPDGRRTLSSLPVADLARMTSFAINQLARRDAVMAGRQGLRGCDWRVVMYSLTSARTLREAIVRCCECFEAIDWRCGKMTLRTHGDTAQLELEAVRAGGSTLGGCLIDLFGMTEVHGLLGWLIDHPIAVRDAWLNHAPEIFEGLDLPDLPFLLRLDEGWNGFQFHASLLDYPVMRSWEDQQQRPLSNLLFVSSARDTDRMPVETRVRGIAMAALKNEGRLPAFGELVSALGGSEATLRRQLAREGTSYRQVRESCRRELALHLLRRTYISIEDIAGQLDYCDSDAFRQAFRAWTGYSPTAYRDGHGVGGRR